jgi:glycosyltransferase involved in cell wall biosynthesis
MATSDALLPDDDHRLAEPPVTGRDLAWPSDLRNGDRRPLRVAMVHLSDFRFDSRIQRQATALAERGDTVDLVCLGEPARSRCGAGLIRVHPIDGPKPSGGGRAYLLGYARFLARAALRLTALDMRSRFDLVEVHNMPDALTLATIVPKLRGTPVILNLHDTFPELFASKFDRPHDGRAVRLLEIEERVSSMLATALITVTDEARVRLAERGVGIGRTHVVMNSPDEGVFGPRRPPVAVPATGEIRVLYHGGLARRYGVDTLVRAVALLGDAQPRITLRVCGDGEDLEPLRELAASVAPDRVDVRGPVPFDAIPAELAAVHIGVVSTRHDRFTELLLPVKLLEYVHMGLPVVTSRLPGIAHYFSEREVQFFAPDDPHDLARALLEVSADPAAARQRAERATERLAAIAWERQRAGYLQLVDRLVANRPRGGARPRRLR